MDRSILLIEDNDEDQTRKICAVLDSLEFDQMTAAATEFLKHFDLSQRQVCGKEIKNGEICWKCEDCGTVQESIICQSCFEHGDHTGHKVWIKYSVSGCCDCGEPDYWKKQGFCKTHQGTPTEQMIDQLPTNYVQNAAIVFDYLCTKLKQILLVEHSKNALGIVKFFLSACQQSKFNAYFLSCAMQSRPKQIKPQNHTCCYQYSLKHENYDDNQCSCSVIDLILQSGQNQNVFLQQKQLFQKTAYSLFLILRQNEDFKVAISQSFWANYRNHALDKVEFFAKNLGCQVLSVSEVGVKIFEDPLLVKVIIENVDLMLENFYLNLEDKVCFEQAFNILNHLTYMAKPELLNKIIQTTNFVEMLIVLASKMHFIDLYDMPKFMEPYPTFSKFFQLYSLDRHLVKVTCNFLQFVGDQQQKIIEVFSQEIHHLRQQMDKMYSDMGFYVIPVLRIFSYFVSRESLKSLVSQGKLQLGKQLIDDCLAILGRHNGFIEEIKSRLWVYKGEIIQNLYSYYYNNPQDFFWADLGLLQFLVRLSPESLIVYIENFGTQYVVKQQLLGHQTIIFKVLNPTLIDPEKIEVLTQCFLTKMVQMCVFETSYLYNYKDLGDQVEKLFTGHLKRNALNCLVTAGANATTEKIKKESCQICVEHEQFIDAVSQVSTKTIDQQGRITFKFKDECLDMFEPFLITKQDQILKCNDSYIQSRVNFLVGSVNSKYKYQTELNSQMACALSQCQPLLDFICRLVEQGKDQKKLSICLKLANVINKPFLPPEIISASDPKLQEICSKLSNNNQQNQNQKEEEVKVEQQKLWSKQTIMQKKKQMIAQMKNKQKQSLKNEVEHETTHHNNCDLCQEVLDYSNFANSPFIQLGYLTNHINLIRCSHRFHYQCFLNYANSFSPSQLKQIDLDVGDLLCPVCRCLVNIQIPLMPEVTGLSAECNLKFMVKAFKVDFKRQDSFKQVVDLACNILVQLTTYKSHNMLKQFNPNTASYDFTLRDVISILKVSSELRKKYLQLAESLEFELVDDADAIQTLIENFQVGDLSQQVIKLMLYAWMLDENADYLVQLLYKILLMQIDRTQGSKDEKILKQIRFLRSVMCCSLIVQSMSKDQQQEQLGLDCKAMIDLDMCVSLESEHEFLVQRLNIQDKQDPLVNQSDLFHKINQAYRNFLQSNNPQPDNNTLTPFFTIEFYKPPPDYHTLLLQNYQKQCQMCQVQLKKSAICLICGDIICMDNETCRQLPGMLKYFTGNDVQNLKSEGQLCYHTRTKHNGCSVYLLIQNAEVYAVNDGRAAKLESFYRNQQGEVFNYRNLRWDTYLLNDESGGNKILQRYQAMLTRQEMPTYILQLRQQLEFKDRIGRFNI